MLKYRVFTVLCRGYMTIVLAVMATFGARTWLAAVGAVGFGVLIDVLRNKYSPDLTDAPAKVIADLSQTTPRDPIVKNPTRMWCWLYGWFAVYVILVANLDWFVGEGVAAFYLTLFQPIHDGVSAFVPAISKNALQLEETGFSYRALLTKHIYSISIVFIPLSSPIATNAIYKGSTMRFGDPDYTRGVLDHKVNPLVIIFFYIIIAAMYWLIADVLSIDTQSRRLPWNIGESNGPYIYLMAFTSTLSLLLAFGYPHLIRMRLSKLRDRI